MIVLNKGQIVVFRKLIATLKQNGNTLFPVVLYPDKMIIADWNETDLLFYAVIEPAFFESYEITKATYFMLQLPLMEMVFSKDVSSATEQIWSTPIDKPNKLLIAYKQQESEIYDSEFLFDKLLDQEEKIPMALKMFNTKTNDYNSIITALKRKDLFKTLFADQELLSKAFGSFTALVLQTLVADKAFKITNLLSPEIQTQAKSYFPIQELSLLQSISGLDTVGYYFFGTLKLLDPLDKLFFDLTLSFNDHFRVLFSREFIKIYFFIQGVVI